MSAVGGRAEVVIASPDFRVGPKAEVLVCDVGAAVFATSRFNPSDGPGIANRGSTCFRRFSTFMASIRPQQESLDTDAAAISPETGLPC